MANMIDPRIAIVPSRVSNHRCVWRNSSAVAPSNSTTTVLGAMSSQFLVLRLAAITASNLGPVPNTFSATSTTAIDSVTIASTDVIRGNQKPIPTKASPQTANPRAAAGAVGTLAGNTSA